MQQFMKILLNLMKFCRGTRDRHPEDVAGRGDHERERLRRVDEHHAPGVGGPGEGGVLDVQAHAVLRGPKGRNLGQLQEPLVGRLVHRPEREPEMST